MHRCHHFLKKIRNWLRKSKKVKRSKKINYIIHKEYSGNNILNLIISHEK